MELLYSEINLIFFHRRCSSDFKFQWRRVFLFERKKFERKEVRKRPSGFFLPKFRELSFFCTKVRS